MKEGFRQSMAWLHTWLGLIVGWVLYYVYLTGNLGYVDKEIDYWMTPDKPYFAATPVPRPAPSNQALERSRDRRNACTCAANRDDFDDSPCSRVRP